MKTIRLIRIIIRRQIIYFNDIIINQISTNANKIKIFPASYPFKLPFSIINNLILI